MLVFIVTVKQKLMLLVAVTMLPFLAMSVYLLISLKGYSDTYDNIVSNMMIANNYNLDFRDELVGTLRGDFSARAPGEGSVEIAELRLPSSVERC